MSPTTSIVELAQRLKGYSAYELNRRRATAHPLSWQRGYFAESVSTTELNRLIGYVRDQRAHHDDAHPMESWLNDELI